MQKAHSAHSTSLHLMISIYIHVQRFVFVWSFEHTESTATASYAVAASTRSTVTAHGDEYRHAAWSRTSAEDRAVICSWFIVKRSAMALLSRGCWRRAQRRPLGQVAGRGALQCRRAGRLANPAAGHHRRQHRTYLPRLRRVHNCAATVRAQDGQVLLLAGGALVASTFLV